MQLYKHKLGVNIVKLTKSKFSFEYFSKILIINEKIKTNVAEVSFFQPHPLQTNMKSFLLLYYYFVLL